ncbi:MAG TPA: formate dehydrogenase accessory protein FdhE [Candidatus Dormibacteraeota bacterium]|nr:formate dehydrogenase accessory protein FdhE [Candidatus Dormibacteraeota bacterium]
MTQTATQGQWDRRIHRANELISSYPFAAEGLRFYARVAELQRSLSAGAAKVIANSPMQPAEYLPLREQLFNPLLLPKFAEFAAQVRQFAPERLAHAAAQLARARPEAQLLAINDFLSGGLRSSASEDAEQQSGDFNDSTAQGLLAWLFLQPFAEFLAALIQPVQLDGTPSACPMCGSNPIVGVLRPEGDGGKKSLVCMLCAHEWAFRRIYCPSCGEEREPQMGFYAAPEIAHVRVDVCDSCHTYLKTVDLTKLGLAIPVVDELATIPLDLWACEHGYAKLQMNLLGT